MTVDEILDQLVADAATRPRRVLTPRRVSLPSLPGKADVIVGMRRSGKTCLLHQKLEDLELAGVPRSRCLYLNLEDERLAPLTARDLHRIPEAHYRRFPASRAEECWLLLGEIQTVAGWERFVRRLLDTERVRIILTGSSSRLLSSEIATSLRGRSLTTELLPFSFEEALAHAGITLPEAWPPASAQRSLLENRFLAYLETGGFPEVQGLLADLRRKILQDYVDVVLLRDVVERHGVANLPALRWLVRRLLRSPGIKLSLHRLHNEMKSQGLKAGKDLLHEMTGHLHDAFFMFPVTISATSEKKRLVNARKFYLVDPALAGVAADRGIEDLGHRLENLVYLELRRRGMEVHYLVTTSGFEVDFAATPPEGRQELLQVCVDPSRPLTRDRELRALGEALRESGLHHATMVTLHEECQFAVEGRVVRAVPAWRWFLEPRNGVDRSGSLRNHRQGRIG